MFVHHLIEKCLAECTFFSKIFEYFRTLIIRKTQNIITMKSRRDSNQYTQSQTLKKIQNVQEFPLAYPSFIANSSKRAMEYHNPKYNTQGGRNSVEPKRPRSQRKSRGSQLVEQTFYAVNEDFFQSRDNLPFARPEKNYSGRFIQQQAARKILLAYNEANQAEDHFKSIRLFPQNSKSLQKDFKKQNQRIRKVRHNSSPFLEDLDRYIDELDCEQYQQHQEQLYGDYVKEMSSNRMYCSIEHEPTCRDIRQDKIIERLMEQRKEKEMIAYKIEMRDKKIKKMNQTTAHMLEYIRRLKDEIESTRQEKEWHLKMLSDFVSRYEKVGRRTAQQQNTYQDHRNRLNYDDILDQQKVQPFQGRISCKQSSGKLKKRGLGNRNMLNQVYFKGRGSNRGSATDFYSYT